MVDSMILLNPSDLNAAIHLLGHEIRYKVSRPQHPKRCCPPFIERQKMTLTKEQEK